MDLNKNWRKNPRNSPRRLVMIEMVTTARTIIWAYLGFPTTPTFLKTNVADYKESENIPGTKKQNLNLENANLKYQNRKPNNACVFLI